MTVVVVLALTGAASGCTGTSTETSDRPYPSALVSQLTSLRQQTGLFTQAGSDASVPPSLYSTAIYPAAARPTSRFDLEVPALVGGDEADIVTSTLYTWAYVTLSGASVDRPVELPERHGLDLALPPVTGDDGQDVGMLWAWADAALRVAPARQAHDVDLATSRLRSVDPRTVASPYVLWRLGTAIDLLGADRSSELDQAWSSVQPPDALDSMQAVLDEQGYLEIVASGPTPQEVDLGARERVAQRLSALEAGDDLPAASLARSLELLGGRDDALEHSLEARVDGPSGLLRPVVDVRGSVHSTYEVAQLIPQDFAAIALDSTRAALHAALDSPTAPSQEKLEALATLQLAGEDTSGEVPREMRDSILRLKTQQVRKGDVAVVVAFVEAARVIDLELPTPTLVAFDVDSPSDEYAGELALAHRDMFANSDQISSWFPTIQEGLLDDALNPREPTRLYLTGLLAISGAGRTTLSGAEQLSAGEALERLRGCPSFPDLHRDSLADVNACDVAATRLAMYSGSAYQASER